jgi:hypothetical protein
MVRTLFNALVATIGFKVTPQAFSFHCVRGTLRQRGFDTNRIPTAALQELAADAYKLSGALSRVNQRSHLVCLSDVVDGVVAQVLSGFFNPDHTPADDVVRNFHSLQILRRHGVKLPIDS